LDVARALQDGEAFLKNAQDEMERKILREDQLYFIDNQVEALDLYLADTEDLVPQSPQLGELRKKLREAKGALEKKSMEFVASQEGGEMPEEIPEAEMAEAYVEYGRQFIGLARNALKTQVKAVSQLPEWEDPLATIKSYLADSEPYVHAHPDLKKVREQLKDRKRELEKRIQDVVQAWRAADLAGGAEEDEE